MNRSALTHRSLRALLALCCFALLAPAAWAQEVPKKIATIEGITEYELSNGLRFLLFPDPSAATVTVNLTVLVGSRHEGYGETGMAHLLEHMTYKGSPAFPFPDKAYQAHGAGRSSNGTTWVDRTNYYASMPANDKNLEFGIHMEADRLQNCYIKREDLVKEMTVVRSEFEMGENSPEYILDQRMMAASYEWHNYGKSTIGNRSDIELVPIDRLKAFYKKYYRPDNAVLVVAGKFEEKKALSLVEKYFGAIKKPAQPIEQTYTTEPGQDGERQVILRRVGTIGAAGLVYHMPSGTHADFPAVDVLDTILTDEPSGRLYKALIDTKKATDVGSNCFAWHDPGVLEIIAKPGDKVTPEELREMLIDQMEKQLFAKPITDEEVQRAKLRMLKYREKTLADSKKIALELSEWIGAGDWRLLFLHRDGVAKVTTADVNRVAAKYIKQNNRTSGVFLPQKQVARADIPPGPNVAELVKNYKGGKDIAEGEAFDPSYANIAAQTKTTELPDGVKVAFLEKKTRGEKVIGALNLRFGNEKSLTGQTAIARFIGPLLTKGTSKSNRQQIQDRLDELGASLNASSGPGSLTIGFEAKRETLPGLLKLLGEVFRDPSFPQNEFDIAKQATIQAFEEKKTDPESLASLALRRKISPYPKDDIRYTPTIEESIGRLQKVTRDQVAEMYNKQIGASTGEFVVVGDFDGKTALKEIQSILAGWKSPVPYERIKTLAITGIPGGRESILTPDKENAYYFGGLAFPLTDKDDQYVPLKLANYILGGTTTSRIWDKLRQEEGLSYGAGSSLRCDSQDKNAGFTLHAICNPENMAKAEKYMDEVILKTLKEGISEDELTRAKQGHLLDSKVSRSKDGVILSYLQSNLHLGRDMKFYADQEKRVEGLTLAEVNAALRAFLTPNRLIIIRAGDFNKKKAPEKK